MIDTAGKEVKGITVELDGNFTNITKSINDANKACNSFGKELGQVNKLLKLDPGNITLTKQKQDLLSQSIEQTKAKLDEMKAAQGQVEAQFKAGEIDGGQYRNFQRELESTKQSLDKLKDEKKSVSVIGAAFDEAKQKAQDLNAKLAPMEEGLKKVGSAAKTITGTGVQIVSKSVDAAAKGLAGYAAALIGVGSAGIGTASDLNEVQNVIDTTFGESSKEIDNWSKTASTAYGLSELQAKQYNGTMGAMLKSMGMTSDQTAKMSESMVGLAGDMASFYNLDTDDAFEKIRAGISGETEPLKQLGINMSEANLSAYALSQGITESYSSMSQAEQTQLRYNYLMSVTADAQGDFAKTSGGFANQQRMAEQQIKSLSGTLSGTFLPALTGSLQAVTEGLPQISTLITQLFSGGNIENIQSQLTSQIAGMATGVVTSLSANLPTFITGFNAIVIGVVSGIGAAMPTAINTLLPVLITGFVGLIQGLLPQVPVLLPVIINAAVTLFMGLLNGLNQIIPQLMAMLPTLIQSVSSTLIKNLPLIITAGIQLLTSLILGITNSIPQLIQSTIALIPVITKALLDNLPALINAGIQLIVALAVGLPQAIPAIIKALPQIIEAIINGFISVNWGDVGLQVIKGIGQGLVDGVFAIGDLIKQAAKSLLNKVKSAMGIHSPSTLFRDEVGKYLALGLGDGFVGQMEKVRNDMAAAIPSNFSSAIDVTGNVTASKGTSGKDERPQFVQNNNYYSPKALSAAETARKTRNDTRQLILQGAKA